MNCPECDGTGSVEKCDWPGEHANRYQEPCPNGCKASGAAVPTDLLPILAHAVAFASVDVDDGQRRHRSEYPEDMQRVGDVLGLWDADGYLTPPGGMHP